MGAYTERREVVVIVVVVIVVVVVRRVARWTSALALGVVMSVVPTLASAGTPVVSSVPTPPVAKGGQVDASSCVAGPVCVSIGWNHHGNFSYLWAERWENGAWSPVTLPGSILNANDQSLKVNCVAATWCMVTASNTPLRPGTRSGPVAVILRGTRWTRVTFPPIVGSWANTPYRLSCVSSSWCMSVGTYAANRRNLVDATFLTSDVWNGTTWRRFAISSPHNAVRPVDPGFVAGGAHPTAIPASLSCVSSTFCVISGTFAGVYNEVWNGTTWHSTNALNRSGYPPGNSSLWAGACVSTTFCLTGGGYYISGSIWRPMIERFDGTSWHNMSLPTLPATYANYQGFTVAQIKCDSIDFCVALVDSSHANPPVNALQWDGTKWNYVGLGAHTTLTRVCRIDQQCIEF